MADPSVAIVHDYLTQRGGAERVVLSMLKAFPDAPIHTSLYRSESTFAGFEGADIRTSPLNRLPLLRRHHRLALPLLAHSFGQLAIDADVTICSSSGWAHGAHTTGRKIVYCYTPARWLYDSPRYLRERTPIESSALRLLRAPLTRWDQRAARTAHRYVTSSNFVRERIKRAYGIDAEVLPPPVTLDVEGSKMPADGLDPGFFLCVSRLLPYKNVDAVVAAFAQLPNERLVIVGSGPERSRLLRSKPENVTLLGAVEDDLMRWLYTETVGLIAASHEDFGLTPLEAAAFGKPAATLEYGGFLDTVIPEKTGIFFARPSPCEIADAVRQLSREEWKSDVLRSHAAEYDESRFIAHLRALVDEVARTE